SLSEEQELAAIGQEDWKPVALLSIEFRHRHRLSPGGGHAEQWIYAGWRKQDDTVRVPGSAAARLCRCQCLGGSTANVDPLQFAIGKEADGLAVGRPEGIVRALSSGQRLRGGRGHAPHPEAGCAVAGSDEDY